MKQCPGEGCPVKQTCTRYEEKALLTKYDFFGTPWNNLEWKCKYEINNADEINNNANSNNSSSDILDLSNKQKRK